MTADYIQEQFEEEVDQEFYEQWCRMRDMELVKQAIESEPVDNPHDDLPF